MADVPAGHPCGTDRCGWPVWSARVGVAWRCNAPFGHDHEHRLTLGGRIRARAWGFASPQDRDAR